MRDLREINGETNVALRAIEARQSMRDIEYGLAVGAWQLDLSRVNAVGRGGPLGLGLHQLGRQHLRELARRADELGDARHHGEHHLATGAPHLTPSRGGGAGADLGQRRWRWRGNWRRRQRWLPHRRNWELVGYRRGLSDE